jgi:hypothetical protein
MIIINTYKTFPSAVPHTTVLIDALELTYTAEEVTVSITGLFTINVLIDTLELTYTAEEVTVSITEISPIPTDGLIVNLDANTMFTSGGVEAIEGEEIFLWGNNVTDNQVSGATPFNTPRPVMTTSPDGFREVDFSNTQYGLSLGQSSDLDFGGYSAATGAFTIIMQSGAGAKDVYWVTSNRDNALRVQDYAFDWYGNTFYMRVDGWRSTNITWPTVPSIVTITRSPNPGTSDGYLDNVRRLTTTTPILPNVPIDSPVVIGSDGIGGNNGYTFDGTMRRVFIWDRLLTDEERTAVHDFILTTTNVIVIVEILTLTYTVETVSVSIIKTATNQILPGNNNAEEIPPTMDLGSSDLELGMEAGLQQVGMRFINLTIPRESTILNANIQFSCDETSSSALTLIIEGEASDNPGIFDSGSSNISSRVRTTNNVSWVPDPWTVVQRRSDAEKTPDISSIIQEIVNRETYQPTDGIVIFIESTGGTGKRTAESSNGTLSHAPTITINYLVGDLPSVTTLIETLTLTYEILEFGVDVGASNEAKPGILQLTYSSPELFVEAFDSVIFLSDYGDDTDTNHVVVGNAIIARNPDLIIHGGDTYPSGAPSDAIAGYSIFQDYIDDEKFLHISGNHDLDYTTTLASLTLGSTIFSLGSAWKFHSLPNATPFPNNWKLTSFDDTSWSGGTGNFGYGDAQNTILDFGGDSLNKYNNYLFRKVIDYSAVTNNGLVLDVRIDDGAEIYVNGVRIYSFNIQYPLTEGSFARKAISTEISNNMVYTESTSQVIRVPSDILQSGENQIAILLKQASEDSSDLTFDMALYNYTFPSVGVFGSRPFYANGYGDGIRSIAPYLPPYLEQYSVVNNNIEFFFLTSGRRSGDGLIASPTMQYSYSQGANWLKYALGDSTALVKILITHDTPVTRISGKNRDYFDYLINNPEYPLDAIIHGDAHVSSVFKHNETGFKVIDASNFRDSARGDSTFTQASNPTQWTNNFIDTTDENNLFLEIRNTNYGARVQFLDVSNNVAFETEITQRRYVPPTLRLIYTAEEVTVN